MDDDKRRRKIKCPGRFTNARTVLAEALDILKIDSPDFEPIDSVNKLEEVVSLVGQQALLFDYDYPDTYFDASRDYCRQNPITGERSGKLEHLSEGDYKTVYGIKLPLSIVPLIAKEVRISPEIEDLYVSNCPRISNSIARFLGFFHNAPKSGNLDFDMQIDLSNVFVPCADGRGHKNLSGYYLTGEFGIGGVEDDVVVSDSPYMIYLMKNPDFKKGLPAATSLGIGFWLNGPEEMLVSQLQQPRGAVLPGNCHIGVIGLAVATKLARTAGFNRVVTYSAGNHPMFLQHPDRKQRGDFLTEFKLYYDKSATTLGFSGTHGGCYVLDLKSSGSNGFHGAAGAKISGRLDRRSGPRLNLG